MIIIKFTYRFHSPVRYQIVSDDKNFDNVEDSSYNINLYINSDIVSISNTVLTKLSSNFVKYMNNPGILDINFYIYNDILITQVTMDHKLRGYEFKRLYTDIQSQLIDGIGKKLSDIILLSYRDNISYSDNLGIVQKPVVKNIYCLLWQYDNWQLVWVHDNRSR